MRTFKNLLFILFAVVGVMAAAGDIKCVSHRGEEFSAPKALTAEKNKLELYGFNIPVTAFEVGAYSAEDILQLKKNNIWCCAYFVHDARSAEKFSKLNFDAFVTGRIAEVRPFCKRSDNNSK